MCSSDALLSVASLGLYRPTPDIPGPPPPPPIQSAPTPAAIASQRSRQTSDLVSPGLGLSDLVDPKINFRPTSGGPLSL